MLQEKRRFIFCINSGRSGSKYLANLLGSADKVVAFHEANPNMSGYYLRLVCEKGIEETFIKRRIKTQAICQVVNNLPSDWTYIETNHMLIKTFYDVVMEEFRHQEIDIIILRRNPKQVLKSFISLGYFSDRNSAWPDWMPLPGACNCAFIPPTFDRIPDQYDLAIGYLLDIEARAQRFILQYPDTRIHEVWLESLQDMNDVKELFSALRILPTDETQTLLGKRINERINRKKQVGIQTTLAYCERRISEYLHECKKQGIEVPLPPQEPYYGYGLTRKKLPLLNFNIL